MLDIYQERQQLREAAKTAEMRAGAMGLDEGYAPHLRDVMDILNDVWNVITPLKVKNCWVETILISVDKPGTVANEPEPGTATNVPSTTDYMQQLTDEEAFEMYNIVTEFAKNKDILTDDTGGQVLDFDKAFFEMARSLEEIENDGDSIVKVRRLIEGWIETEDTEYYWGLLSEEVHMLMDVDAMCKLSKVAEEVEDKADVTTLEPKEPAMFDDVNQISTMIKCLSVQACGLGEEFGNAAVALYDASNTIRAIYRKMENVCRVSKMKNAKQTCIKAFFTAE
jgi:hypothetical protein